VFIQSESSAIAFALEIKSLNNPQISVWFCLKRAGIQAARAECKGATTKRKYAFDVTSKAFSRGITTKIALPTASCFHSLFQSLARGEESQGCKA